MTKPTANQDEMKFYLVGRVPVQLQERPEGVFVRAFNPLLGGFVSDARYYSTIKRHEHDEDGVRQIDEAEFNLQVEKLKGSEFYTPI